MAAVAWRFSLLGLFGVVGIVAIACAALTNPTPLWACVVETGVLATLTYGVLAAVFRREARRAFWIGLSIVGWGYALLVAGHNKLDGSVSWNVYGNSGFISGESHLATTQLVLWWAQKRETPPWTAAPPAYTSSATTPIPPVYDGTGSANPIGSPTSDQPTLAPSVNGEPGNEPTTFISSDAPPLVASEVPAGPFIQTQHVRVSSARNAPGAAVSTPSLAAIAYYDPERYPRLLRIGEYLWALLLGIAGGFVARWMCANCRTITATGS